MVVLAGYLVWLRNQYQVPITSNITPEVTVTVTPTEVAPASSSAAASPSASPKKGATTESTSGAKAK